MAFIIANILPLETINELNERFNLSIKRININNSINSLMGIPKAYGLDKIDWKFERMKRFMEQDDEVIYERNTY